MSTEAADGSGTAMVDGQKWIYGDGTRLVSAMMTDRYQLSMAYAYWRAGRHEEFAVFELYFRKNPFRGEYTVFAGLTDALGLLQHFNFSQADLDYLSKEAMPDCHPGFFDWLKTLNCSALTVRALQEGSVCFPSVPLLSVEGPLGLAQLLETALLNLTNFSSLVCTNAARFRHAAGPKAKLLEFGLRRAQGPDGAMTASRYSYMGGFDGTSNMMAGRLAGIKTMGTHAHSFVQSYSSFDQIHNRQLDGKDLVSLVQGYQAQLGYTGTNQGELAAYTAYALAFPKGFLALVDTYDTLGSGVPNYICVALALAELGYTATGVRLDSGDLAYLSKEARKMFREVGERLQKPFLQDTNIVASNDINEDVLHALHEQGHDINTFGIGTNLVTCQAQPALGCVYKLVEIKKEPRIKLSQAKEKITLPGCKAAYRLYGANGLPLLDLLTTEAEDAPVPGQQILCRHPFESTKRASVTPSRVVLLHQVVWDGPKGGVVGVLPSIHEIRERVIQNICQLREDVRRHLNPTPYKVSVSVALYDLLNRLVERDMPISQLS